MPWLTLSPEVRAALAAGRPCVALESTVIAHGLPYPRNVETALRLEALVREHGATPATIGILAGQAVVGLDRAQIEHLASAPGVVKVSRRDLPLVVALRQDGATTVAATSWLAHRAGIAVFATGGIGGVHRGHPFDVSADLPELAQTQVLVVCAGAKAVLDLPLTREWLETHGVPVIGYGTDSFPAFYHRDSGLPVDARAGSPSEVAAMFRAQRELGLPGGMLVAAPVPAADELPAGQMKEAIALALAEAEAAGVSGKALTPFLLSRISDLTGEASLRANVSLLENNARLAAQIACALAG